VGVTAQYPPGRWKHPVTLVIKDGRLVDIKGKTEAEQVRWFLETYGDENSWLVGGEISVGLNKLCQKDNDSVREWKKTLWRDAFRCRSRRRPRQGQQHPETGRNYGPHYYYH
jgi:hypothetical protein